jgi:rRNA maturation endonuclease Nob1
MPQGRYECYRCGREVTDPNSRVCPDCAGALRDRGRPVE